MAGAQALPYPDAVVHEVAGADARAFLHRMLTQDVASLRDGEGRPAAFLDVRGRVMGDPVVGCVEGRLHLVWSAAAAARALPSLERYVIADDVAFADVTAAHDAVLVFGAGAVEVAGARREAQREAQRGITPGLASADLGWRGVPAFVVLGAAGAVLPSLLAAGASRADAASLDAVRVEALVPWYGRELDDRVLPNEAGLDASISWTKGCYLGQEPVVMARHRGRPPTRLARLGVEGAVLPAQDDPLRLGDRVVGRLTTAVRREGGVGALGYVRTEVVRVGADLALAEGRRAVVEAVVP